MDTAEHHAPDRKDGKGEAEHETKGKGEGEGEGATLSETEEHEAEERMHPRAQVLYEAIRREGEYELDRPASALAWSGLAAGLSMGFSLLAQGLLRAYLPEAPWARLIVSLGYCVGFVVVIVARQQLFTENTLTPVIPFLAHKDARTFWKVLRLWSIVFVCNLAGTFAVAAALHSGHAFSEQVRGAFAAIARQATEGSAAEHFARAIFSGWLIALMVWMLAGASARAFVVIVISYIVGLGDLSHVIAGSTEAVYAALEGELAPLAYFTRFVLPVGLGNVLGGVALVALLAHAQVAADEKGGSDVE
jgi:formate/nitrite transporter FocA (FNT family)